MAEFGQPLDSVAIEYAATRKILDGHNLADAARFFIRHHGRGLEGKPVVDAVAEFIDTKRTEGRSVFYITDLRYRLGSFAQAFNMEVRQLALADVRDFLSELKLGARSYNNHLQSLKTFFRFCQSRGSRGRPPYSKVSASARKHRRTSKFSRRRSFGHYCMRRRQE